MKTYNIVSIDEFKTNIENNSRLLGIDPGSKNIGFAICDENKKVKEEHLHGMSSRIFQHENEHMNGYLFTDLVSKLKLDRAKIARTKMIKNFTRDRTIRK